MAGPKHVSSEPSAFQSSRNSPSFPTEDELNLEAIMEHSFMCTQMLLKYFQKWDSKIYLLNVTACVEVPVLSVAMACESDEPGREKQVSFSPLQDFYYNCTVG